MKSRRTVLCAVVGLLLVSATTSAYAQPRPIPNPNPRVQVPNIQFNDPFGVLSQAVRNGFVRTATTAVQQLQNSIAYLQNNRRAILNGTDPLYRQFFGPSNKTREGFIVGQTIGRSMNAQGNTITFTQDEVFFFDQIQVGDEILIGGELHVVAAIALRDIPQNNNQNMEGRRKHDGRITQTINTITTVDPIGANVDPMSPVQPVLDRTEVVDDRHLEHAIAGFQNALDQLLRGQVLVTGDSTNAEYQTILGAAYGAGNDPFAGIDQSNREYGFSNSPSPAHIDQLLNDPGNPLLWTDDAGFFEQFHHLLTAQDDALNDRLSIAVGPAFLQELQFFVGPKFDGRVRFNSQQTALFGYQMLIAALLESGPDLEDPTTDTGFGLGAAGFGIRDALRVAGVSFFNDILNLQHLEAESYALFANLFGNPQNATGVGRQVNRGTRPGGKNLAGRGNQAQTIIPAR